MSKPLPLYGKFILVIVIFVIFTVFLYTLRIGTDFSLLILFLLPLIIILFGKMGESVIHILERASTGPLSFIRPQNTLLLMCYYASLSTFFAILVENSIILSLFNFRPTESQVAIISLSLAFLPRVLSYASGMERARNILLAVLTPLTLTAAVLLLFRPTSLVFRLQTLEICIIGSLILPIIGDLSLYFAGFVGIIHPTITMETISLLDLRRLVDSQLETMQWDRVCQILKEAKRVNRVDIVHKILDAMSFFNDESRKRRAVLARIIFIDALIKTMYFESQLRDDLNPFFINFKEDKAAEVRARAAYGFGVLSKMMPDKSIEVLSELLNDNDVKVLEAVGGALEILLRNNLEAASLAIKLSLNPSFLNQIMKGPIHVRASPGGSSITFGQNPVINALRTAYTFSPETISTHIQECSSSNDLRLRLLAAEILSDPDFGQDDRTLVKARARLKKDKNFDVKMRLKTYIKSIPFEAEYLRYLQLKEEIERER